MAWSTVKDNDLFMESVFDSILHNSNGCKKDPKALQRFFKTLEEAEGLRRPVHELLDASSRLKTVPSAPADNNS